MTEPTPKGILHFLIALVSLTVATWAIGLLDIQYRTESTLAFESSFPGDTAAWKLGGDPSNISLTSSSVIIERVSAQHSYAMRKYPLPPAEIPVDRQLRVRGDISTLKQASRTKINAVAAYMIWFQDENDDTIQYTTIQALTGDFSEYRAERIVGVPTNAHAFTIVLINRDSDGTFELTDANVASVTKTELYQNISFVLFTLWLCMVVLSIVWLATRGGTKLGISVGAFLVLTLIGVLIPESITSNYILPTYKALTEMLSLSHSEPLGAYYKLGHFIFFFAVSLSLILNRHQLQLSVFILMLLLLTFAVATEGLQLHLYNRSTRLSDIGIDMSGVILATLLGLAWQRRKKNTTHTDDLSAE